jgi:hypothetical protein
VQAAAPDYIEPVLGWRVWLVVEHRGALRLGSVLYPNVWEPRRDMAAGCDLPSDAGSLHLPPHGECTCGLYAAASVTDAISYFDGYGQNSKRPVYRVVGRVSLWGRIIEGDRGWRASHAYPSRIYVPDRCLGGETSLPAESVAVALGDYGVPLEIVDGRTKGRIMMLLADDSALAA